MPPDGLTRLTTLSGTLIAVCIISITLASSWSPIALNCTVLVRFADFCLKMRRRWYGILEQSGRQV